MGFRFLGPTVFCIAIQRTVLQYISIFLPCCCIVGETIQLFKYNSGKGSLAIQKIVSRYTFSL